MPSALGDPGEIQGTLRQVGPLTPQDRFLRIRHPEIIAVFYQRKAIVDDGIFQRISAGHLRKPHQVMINSQFCRGNRV